MSLEDTLRWAKNFPMRSSYEDARYQTESGFDTGELYSNWAWAQLWEQENPDPRLDANLVEEADRRAAFNDWYSHLRQMQDRVWVAACFPQFRVWDWNDEDVKAMRDVMRRHVCGVDGRFDDPGCAYGC